ncbi:MAG: hypothetical protein PHI97_27520 [Desulfobulbus sp.]|nr:hypothetical protein [Desulfobulbus sp.]
MHLLRRGFYLLIGFTFPGFWVLHASGFIAVLYRPLQLLFHTKAVGWPALITASLLYLGVIVGFEALRYFLVRLNRE